MQHGCFMQRCLTVKNGVACTLEWSLLWYRTLTFYWPLPRSSRLPMEGDGMQLHTRTKFKHWPKTELTCIKVTQMYKRACAGASATKRFNRLRYRPRLLDSSLLLDLYNTLLEILTALLLCPSYIKHFYMHKICAQQRVKSLGLVMYIYH